MVNEDATVRFSPSPDLDEPVVGVVLGANGNSQTEFYENGFQKSSIAFPGLLNPGQLETFQFDFDENRSTLTVAYLDENNEPKFNVLSVDLGVTSGLDPVFVGVYAG